MNIVKIRMTKSKPTHKLLKLKLKLKCRYGCGREFTESRFRGRHQNHCPKNPARLAPQPQLDKPVWHVTLKNHPNATNATNATTFPDGPNYGGSRPATHDYSLIPKLFLDELVSIFEEGLEKYGRHNWRKGGKKFLADRMNHAMEHLLKYQEGDRTENHLAKIAWGVLVKRYFDLIGGSDEGN